MGGVDGRGRSTGRNDQHGFPCKGASKVSTAWACAQQRRRTWGKHVPGAVCLPAGNGTRTTPFRNFPVLRAEEPLEAGGVRLGNK